MAVQVGQVIKVGFRKVAHGPGETLPAGILGQIVEGQGYLLLQEFRREVRAGSDAGVDIVGRPVLHEQRGRQGGHSRIHQ